MAATIFLIFAALPALMAIMDWRHKTWRKSTISYMTAKPAWRKLYCKVLLLVAIFFHLVFTIAFPHNPGIMLSSCLLLYMVSTDRMERLLLKASGSVSVLVFLVTLTLGVAMATMFTAFLLPTAIVLGYITVAVCWFPATLVYHKAKDSGDE